MPSTATASGPYSQWCPPEITAAGVPLNDVGRIMRALAEERSSVVDLLRSSPLPEVREAFDGFLRAWMLALYSISGEAMSLATLLRFAAEDYVGSEADLARGLAHR